MAMSFLTLLGLFLKLVTTVAQRVPPMRLSIDQLDVQLVMGSSPNEGRVLIRWSPDSPWTAVCHDFFLVNNAVPFQMCRRMGYPFACGQDYAGSRRTDEASLVNITSERFLVSCAADSTDPTFGGCSLEPLPPSGDPTLGPPCTHDNDMWLSCGYSGMPDFELRLVEESYLDPGGLLEGRCSPQDEWRAICGSSFHRLRLGRVACRELGFSDYAVRGLRVPLERLDPQRRPNLDLFVDIGCIGNETSLTECQHYSLRECSKYLTIECFTGVTEYEETSYLCGSKQLCREQCEQPHPINGSSDDIFHYCQCDDVCGLFDDCCYDYGGMCSPGPPELNRGGFSIEQFGCVWVPGSQFTHIGYVAVDRCQAGWTDEGTRDLCERPVNITDVIGSLPVYDEKGVDFKNTYCAICNGRSLKTLKRWDVSATYDDQYPSLDTFYPSLNETLPSLGWIMTPPRGHDIIRQCSAHLIDTCMEEFRGSRLEAGCKAYYAPVKVEDNYIRYKNPHCAMCNGENIFPDSSCMDQTCTEYCAPDPWGPCAGICSPFDGFLTIEVLFDFSSSSSINGMSCSIGQIFDPFLERCRVLTCATGYEIHGNECVPAPSISPFPSNNESLVIDCLTEGSNHMTTVLHVGTKVQQMMSTLSVSVLVRSASDVRNLEIIFDSSVKSVVNDSSLPCNISALSIFLPFHFNVSSLCNNYSVAGSDVFPDYSGRILAAARFLHISIAQYAKESVAPSCLRMTELNCSSLLTLRDTEYSMVSAKRIHVFATENNLSADEFVLLPDGSVVVCSYIGPVPEGVELQVRRALSFVGSCLSLIALAATFVTYCVFPDLRNLAGIATMNLVVALFLAILLFLLSGYLSQSQAACEFGAVVAHFAWLAAFLWMTMLAVKVARTLTSMVPSSGRRRVNTRELIVYICLAWGVPFLIVCICIILQYCNCPTLPVIYAQGSICWISDATTRLVAFTVPMTLSLVFNLCLYVCTIISVRRNRRSSRAVRKHSKLDDAKEELVIYARLCALVGVTWVFGFVSQSVTGILAFSYIYIILNYLQGVFIFAAFCLNKKVRNLWREKFGMQKEVTTTGGTTDPKHRSRESALVASTLPDTSEDSKL